MEKKTKKKSTAKLETELKHASSIVEFVRENESELKAVTVPEFLNEMLISQ